MRNKKKINLIGRRSGVGLSLLLVLLSLLLVSCGGGNTPAPNAVQPLAEAETPPAQGQSSAEEKPQTALLQPEPSAMPEPSAEPEPSAMPEPSTAPEPSAFFVPPQDATTLAETADMGRAYLDKFVFLGDSTTYGLGFYYSRGYSDLVPPEQVWTPANGTLTLDQWSYVNIVYPQTGEEMKLADLLALTKPEYICITLGVNGVSFMNEDYFKQSYTSLVEKVQEVSPDTTVILNSIYPVTVGYEAKRNGINNDTIRAANFWVHDIAESCGVHYLDSASVLRNENGALPDSYTNGDGLHLTGESFRLVIGYLRTHGC